MWYRWVWLFFVFFLSVRDVVAEQEAPFIISSQNSVEVSAFQERFQRMLITLFGLVAFMILGAIAIKQWMRVRAGQANQGSSIQLLETRALSHKVALHLIEIEGDRILVGETASHVSLLSLTTGSTKKGEDV